jgi:hypothetical protein
LGVSAVSSPPRRGEPRGDSANEYPTLSGETLVVPIVGDPIAQVKSPDGITRMFAARGCNAVVVPLQVTPGDFDALIGGLSSSSSVGGLIATVPHKFALTAHCATLTDRARFLGSVNVTRRNPDGTWHGDQVDGAAFVAAVRAAGGTPRAHVPCRSAPGARARRLRSPCWRRGLVSWRCTTPTPPAATTWSDGCGSVSATASPSAHRTRPGSTSSRTRPRWGCAPPTPTR